MPEISSPEDTRYFEDEANESKKFAQKPLIKSKEYTGKNLPFIGYSFVQNAKPNISWGKDNEVVTKESAEVAVKLKLELAGLKESAAKDARKILDIQKSLMGAEREKNKIENELKIVKLARDERERDNMELETKMSQLKQNITNLSLNNNDVNELLQVKKRLEEEISHINRALEEERASLNRKDQKIGDLNSHITILESDILSLNQKYKLKEIDFKQLELDYADAKKKLDAYVDSKKSDKLKQDYDNLCLKHLETESMLSLKVEECDILLQKILEFEKQVALSDIEIESRKKQIDELESEKIMLVDKLNSIENLDLKNNPEEFKSLRDQIELLTANRQQLIEENNRLSKAKILIEIESVYRQKCLNQEKDDHQTTKQLLEAQQQAHTLSKEQINFFKCQQESIAAKMEVSNKTFEKEKCDMLREIDALNAKSIEQKKKSDDYSQENADLKLRLELEIRNVAYLKAKFDKIDSEYSAVMKEKLTLQSDLTLAKQLNLDLSASTEKTGARLEFITAERDDLRLQLLQLRNDVTDLENRENMLSIEKSSVEDQLEDLKVSRKDIEKAYNELKNKLGHAEANKEDLQKELNLTKGKYDSESNRVIDLEAQLLEYKNLCEIFKTKIRYFEEKDDESSNEKKKVSKSLKSLFFRKESDFGSTTHAEEESHFQSSASLDSLVVSQKHVPLSSPKGLSVLIKLSSLHPKIALLGPSKFPKVES